MQTKFGNAIPNSYGHYVITGGKYRGKRLHRLVYEDYYNIKIPDDYDIHHIDEDKSNNSIDNLVLMTHEEHTILHKSNDDWRVIKKGVNDDGEQLYALYSPSGKKIRTSTNEVKLIESMERRKKQDTIKHEKPEHLIIFEKYYDMGDKRTLKQLSEETEYSVTTLSKWKKEYDWENKIINRDNSKLQMMTQDRLEADVLARGVYQDTIRQILKEQVIEPLTNGTFDIEVKNVSDIKRLIELDNMLAVQNRTDNNETQLDDEDKEVIDLIENDEGAWEMLTQKLRNDQEAK